MIALMLRGLIVALALVLGAGPAAAIAIERVRSPGGIEAWLVRDATLPLLSIEFRFRGGAASEPADRIGLATLATEMMREGAGDIDAQAFAREIENRSISLSFGAATDFLYGGMRVLNDHRARGAELLRLALTRPRMEAASLERVRARLLAGLARESEDPRALARRAFNAAAFPGHPYSRDLEPMLAGTRSARADELRGFLRARLARDNLTVGVVGDIEAEALGRLLDEIFGDLPAAAEPVAVPEAQAQIDRGRTLVIERRLPQSVMLFGGRGLKRDDPDWFAAQLVNYVFGGGGFSSRLMNEVRVKRGLTYGIGTFISAQDFAATVVGSSSTENMRAAQSLEIIRTEWRRMAEEGPSAEELADAKSYLTGSFALNLDSTGAVARLLVSIQYERLGIDYLARRDGLIAAVTIDDARRVARRLFGGEGFLTVVVGQPDGIRASP